MHSYSTSAFARADVTSADREPFAKRFHLTQQFAALIGERTGLPLFDLRPPERKAKQKKQKEQPQARS